MEREMLSHRSNNNAVRQGERRMPFHPHPRPVRSGPPRYPSGVGTATALGLAIAMAMPSAPASAGAAFTSVAILQGVVFGSAVWGDYDAE
jgi:hypothetical protein